MRKFRLLTALACAAFALLILFVALVRRANGQG